MNLEEMYISWTIGFLASIAGAQVLVYASTGKYLFFTKNALMYAIGVFIAGIIVLIILNYSLSTFRFG